jgi:hypothetical protein
MKHDLTNTPAGYPNARATAHNSHSSGIAGPAAARTTKPFQLKANNTGLPDNLKSGIESLSGFVMDDVNVHYNSDKPAQLQAHAYAQGTNIHVAPGQEKHLPHEAWHVVQQKQGRVQGTTQMKGVDVNDSLQLENEADIMGRKALSFNAGAIIQPMVNPGLNNDTSPFQLMAKGKFDELSEMFKPQVKWESFYKQQHQFQTAKKEEDGEKMEKETEKVKDKQKENDEKKEDGENEGGFNDLGTGGLSYTTFGTEYEMIPYYGENVIGNTAHIKLAQGNAMPVEPNVREALVTDADNVIEYVSPVFILPLNMDMENTTEQVVLKIASVRNKLMEFRKKLKVKNVNFKALLKSEPMEFTTWTMEDKLKITFKEIDESTNVDKFRHLSGDQRDIENILLGPNDFSKNSKHKELNKETLPGSALQSTVLLPLDLVAKIIRGSMDDRNEKAAKTGFIQNSAKKKDTQKSTKGTEDLTNVMINAFRKDLKSVENPDVLNSIYLFCQRLALILEAPDAVKFQAHYQSMKFSHNVVSTIKDPEVLKKYDEAENQYNVAKGKGKLTEIPNNFHNAHSGIKDRLSVWTRIHMDDLVISLAKKLRGNAGDFFDILTALLKEYGETGQTIISKIKQIIKSKRDYTTHDAGNFLEDNEAYLDLRQDTLRDVKVINGKTWVLVEIRDLKDDTLENLKKYERK